MIKETEIKRIQDLIAEMQLVPNSERYFILDEILSSFFEYKKTNDKGEYISQIQDIIKELKICPSDAILLKKVIK